MPRLDEEVPGYFDLIGQGFHPPGVDIQPMGVPMGGGMRAPARTDLAKQLTLPLPPTPQPQRGIMAYHGSPEPDLKQISTRYGNEARGASFHASNRDAAELFTRPRAWGEPVYEDDDGNPIPEGRVYQTNIIPRYPYEVPQNEAQKFLDDTGHQQRTLDMARRKGHDAVIARNVNEGFGGESVNTDVIAALRDEIVRLIAGVE